MFMLCIKVYRISIIMNTTIGEKSIGHNVVGNIDLIFRYIGFVISLIKLMLILTQKITSHDKIISVTITNFIKSKNVKITSKI